MEEIAQALKDLQPILERLTRISGFTEWGMFGVTFVIAFVAIVISFVQSSKSSTSLAKIESLSADMRQYLIKQNRFLVETLFSQTKEKESEITIQKLKEYPKVPEETVKDLVGSGVTAATNIASHLMASGPFQGGSITVNPYIQTEPHGFPDNDVPIMTGGGPTEHPVHVPAHTFGKSKPKK